MNKHVTSLELSKKLKKHSREVLGNTNRGKKNGNYGYRKSRFYPSELLRSKLIQLGVPRNKHDIVTLGEMLPPFFTTYKTLDLNLKPSKYVCGNSDTTWKTANTESDARAKMLIYLLENKII